MVNTKIWDISAKIHNRDDGYKENILLLQENMDGQVQNNYQDVWWELDNAYC